MIISGEQEIVIDGDKWDQTIKDAYKENYLEYEGEVVVSVLLNLDHTSRRKGRWT